MGNGVKRVVIFAAARETYDSINLYWPPRYKWEETSIPVRESIFFLSLHDFNF